MHLARFSVSDFQSYRDAQTITFDPHLTLLAGRNDVGKSALLRVLRLFIEPQQGAGEQFRCTFEWNLSSSELVEAVLPPGTESQELQAYIETRPVHSFSVEFRRGGMNEPLDSSNLWVSAIRLPSLSAEFASSTLGIQGGWTSGPWAGAAPYIGEFERGARTLASRVVHVAPRQVESGVQQLRPVPRLSPDARNLTNVVSYLVSNERTGTFRQLEEFMAQAFPQIATIGAPVDVARSDSGTPHGELHVYYKGGDAGGVPLRLCGTGLEQMLALAVRVLTEQTPFLFLIDEPQAYLHPGAERSLLELLEANPEHQYVVATHSGVFLNARPISSARLLTIESGATRVADLASPEALLTELGFTAADLWLADDVLWVEGASEAAVIAAVAPTAPGVDAALQVRAMPDASRFSAKSQRQAEATYRFCEAIGAALAPLPMKFHFLFDSDEKSDEVRERITAASGGRASFLPARELENLFLDADTLHAALVARAEATEQSPPAFSDVESRLNELLADADDDQLFPAGPGGAPLLTVAGSRVLQALYWEFTTSEYDKVADGELLASLQMIHQAERLEPLFEVLRRVSGG